jgi:hypothetical protein
VFFQEKTKNKIVWQYYITCAEAVDVLRTLEGYLISKKEQAVLAIYFHDNKMGMTGDEKSAAYDKMRKIKKDIYETNQLLTP